MSTRIEKTIARQKEKIAEGNFYEAHQQLRVIATRYVKATNWQLAIDILYNGALALLQAGQGGSGGDLGLYLVEVYNKAHLEPTAETKGQVFGLLRTFPSNEPTRRRFLGDALAWTSAVGEFPSGDPELHHLAGTLYARESEPYDAEKHFALGTRDSPEALARMEYDWYSQYESHKAPMFAARCIFPYLLTRNLRSANKAFIVFTARLSSLNKDLGFQDVGSSTADVRVYPSLPLINFLSMLLLACQRGNSELFRQLRIRYSQHLREMDTWTVALDCIGEIWFGIATSKQANPLLDMMGSMLFGGSSTGAGERPGATRSRLQASNTNNISPAYPD